MRPAPGVVGEERDSGLSPAGWLAMFHSWSCHAFGVRSCMRPASGVVAWESGWLAMAGQLTKLQALAQHVLQQRMLPLLVEPEHLPGEQGR